MLPYLVDIMKMLTLRYLLTFTIVCLLGGVSVTSFADEAKPVGAVLFVHGEVSIFSSDGVQREASRGGSIFEGDRIVSSAASSMQIKMVDSGYLAVRPSTEIRIDKYRFEQTQSDRAETSLLRGGLRSITGTIGKTRKESFKLRTPVATIGIRGTDLEVFYVPSSRSAVLAKGAYLRINSGRGYIQTLAGVQFVQPNQTGFVSDRRSAPKLVVLPPDLFNKPDAEFWPTDSEGSSEDEGSAGLQEGSESGANDEGGAGSSGPQFVENDGSPSDDDAELVDLDLPPDLQESWDSEYQPEEQTYYEITETDLGVLSTVTSTEVVTAQTGTFSYAPSSMEVSEGSLSASSVALDIDFNADLVTYDLMLDFSSPISPAAVSGANGGQWAFKGEGALSSFIGDTGLTLSGYYTANGDQQSASPNANGIWYGFFTGSNADGLFSSFELSSSGYSVTGFTETTQRNEFFKLADGYSLILTDGRDRSLYGSSGIAADAFLNSDGALIKVDASEVIHEALDSTYNALANGGSGVAWGHWDGYSLDYPSDGGSTNYPNESKYYVYFNSDLVNGLNSIPHSKMHAKYSLAGLVAHNSAGNAFSFDRDTSFLMLDFNSGVVQGQLEMYSSDADGNQESWWLNGYSNLNDISGGSGAMSLFGSVYNNSKELTDDVDGQWDFAWGGSSGEFLAGGFYLSGTMTDIDQNLIFSAEGVMVFAGETPNALLLSENSKGLISAGHSDFYQSLAYSRMLSFNFDTLSGAYVDIDNTKALVGYYKDNQSYSIDDSTASLVLGETQFADSLDSGVSHRVIWGRWDNVNDTDILYGNGEGIETAKVLHYIMAYNFTTQAALENLATSGISATYSLAGGTAPSLIDSSGNVTNGVLNSLNLDVDFSGGTIITDLSIDISNQTVTAFGGGSLTDFMSNGIALDSESALGYMSGTMNGQFVGSNADGAIVSYELSGGDIDPVQINGVAALQQSSTGQSAGGLP